MAEGESSNTEVKESVLLAWKALEYPEYTRDLRYYALVGLLFLVLIGYSIFMRDWYGIGILVILIGFILWYQTKKPVEHVYRASQLGLYVDNRFYAYNEIYSFWLLFGKNSRSLNIIFNKKYLPQLTIILENVDPLVVRTTLGKYIPEENSRKETISDRLVRLFRL